MKRGKSRVSYRKGPVQNRAGTICKSECLRRSLSHKKGVRFIAINDGVDSAQGDNDLTPLKNLFNEWMVRDTSRKIKAVFRSKGMSGKPITSQPVYGYSQRRGRTLYH